MSDPTDPDERIGTALEQVGSQHAPSSGWEARVFAAIELAEKADADGSGPAGPRTPLPPPLPRPHRWRLIAIAAGSVAVLAATSLLVLRPEHRDAPGGPTDLALDVTWDLVGPLARAGSSAARVGDVAHATATGGAGHRAVWVYRNERLIVACPGAPACRESAGATAAEVTLRAHGWYVFVAVSSRSPLPIPSGTYDTDQADLIDAGATVQSQLLEAR